MQCSGSEEPCPLSAGVHHRPRTATTRKVRNPTVAMRQEAWKSGPVDRGLCHSVRLGTVGHWWRVGYTGMRICVGAFLVSFPYFH